MRRRVPPFVRAPRSGKMIRRKFVPSHKRLDTLVGAVPRVCARVPADKSMDTPMTPSSEERTTLKTWAGADRSACQLEEAVTWVGSWVLSSTNECCASHQVGWRRVWSPALVLDAYPFTSSFCKVPLITFHL